MTKVKSTLESLISEGFTPLQIALELDKLQGNVYQCPECKATKDIYDTTPSYVEDYEKSECRNCNIEWKGTKFTFGQEIL